MHYDCIISKTNSLLGFIYRNTKDFQDPHTLKALYNSLIRSRLEYCCIVWSPYCQKSSVRIEKVQKRFTRFALRKMDWNGELPNYDARCGLLGLKPLSKRRIYYSVLFAQDVLTNHLDCPYLLSLFNVYAPSRTLRPRDEYFLYVPKHRTNYGLNEPVTSACINFNLYSDKIDFNMNRPYYKNLIMNLM